MTGFFGKITVSLNLDEKDNGVIQLLHFAKCIFTATAAIPLYSTVQEYH